MVYLTVIAGLELLAIAGLVVALLLERKACAELIDNMLARHANELARFLAAVQRPDVVQPVHPPKLPSKDELERRQRQAQNLASVGTVSHAAPKEEP